jgi:hypothetical protein
MSHDHQEDDPDWVFTALVGKILDREMFEKYCLPDDLHIALDQLERTDPFVRERYARDAEFRAEVDEHVFRARLMAEGAKLVKRRDILRSESTRRRYDTDEQFRQAMELRVTEEAIAAIKQRIPEAAPIEDETKH